MRLVLRDYTDFEAAKVAEELGRGGFGGRYDLIRAANHGRQIDNIFGQEMFPRHQPMPFDLYVKIDDDDLYTDGYLKSVVDFHQRYPGIQLSCLHKVETWAATRRGRDWAVLSGNSLALTPEFLTPFIRRMDDGSLLATPFEDAALMHHAKAILAPLGWRTAQHVLYIRHGTNASAEQWPEVPAL